ncbi:MAG: DUF2304 domain-containing protein [Erysipelotrichaceae bacterium]|nr:DUF2304 domain-containing protein [Erysipelotrichaceae bacterium]
MSLQVQILLIIGSVLFFLFLVRNIKKSKLSIEMAVIWVLWGIGIIVISIFPQLVYKLTRMIGIQAPINTIFLIMIFLLYTLTFFLYIKISVLEDKTKSAIQEIALLRKELEDYAGKHHNSNLQ